MTNNIFAIAVYPVNNHFVVRKCCSPGYTMHATEGGLYRYAGCTCEILATESIEEQAIKLGQKFSEDLNVQLILN